MKKHEKDAKTQGTPQSESLCTTILSKMIKDILGNELTTGIVNDIINQQPRLYCFFDKSQPIKVNKNEVEMKDERLITGPSQEDATQLRSRKPSIPFQKSTVTKMHDESGSIDEQKPRRVDSPHSLEAERKLYDPSQLQSVSRRGRDSPQLSANSTHEKDEANRTRHLNVPDHLSPQDIIIESDQEQKPESIIQNDGYMQEEKAIHDHAIQQLMTKEEFKLASQAVFDDIFFSLIKESVSGSLNLNEKQIRSSTLTGPKRTLTRMRSHLNINQQPSASHLK